MGAFKEPHGGVLKELYLGESAAEQEKQEAREYKSWDLADRQLCDLDLILNGAFSPLDGFLNKADTTSVMMEMRLTSKILWPIPINLDVTEAFADSLSAGENIALRDHEGVIVAVLTVEDVWKADKLEEANRVYGTELDAHPGVDYLLNHANEFYVGGKVRGIEPPAHYDFKLLRFALGIAGPFPQTWLAKSSGISST